MNEKGVSEIRRRFKSDKSNITHIRGCYINEAKEIVAEFNQSLTLMTEEEAERFLLILKRTLSGTINKNLLDIEFTTQQVLDSEEHKLLMDLRDTKLKNEDMIHDFFQRAIEGIPVNQNYLILLAYDTYDIPFKGKDGATLEDASSDMFSYILCSVCPIKITKPALSYQAHQNTFGTCTSDWIVSPPEMGFMFPAFDDRSANIYNALYYTRSAADSHEDFVQSIFNTEVPVPAEEQKEMFQSVLSNTLQEECKFEIVQAVHNKIQQMVEQHKEAKEEEPLLVSKETVKKILKSNGVSDEHMQSFDERFDETFGADTNINPQNIVDVKTTQLMMPDVKIQINSERNDLVETRVIDGKKYILIKVEQGVELNGIPVKI